ncbi:hypothetical protein LR48_Vigan07g223500 [Vigna angularis]|uniref:Uncharacterized protein n=1 Tax=Phaseolus angularis TaxID=3914 RepID=A0A0L9V0R7_PHAAN|nr:hypothetical protein LR48_Vigan07g223500 [Vigna angularis]
MSLASQLYNLLGTSSATEAYTGEVKRSRLFASILNRGKRSKSDIHFSRNPTRVFFLLRASTKSSPNLQARELVAISSIRETNCNNHHKNSSSSREAIVPPWKLRDSALKASSSQKLHSRPTNKNHQTKNQALNREIQHLTATTPPPRPRRAMRKEFPSDLAKLSQAQRDTLEQQRENRRHQRVKKASNEDGVRAMEACTRKKKTSWVREEEELLREEEED